MVRPPQSAANFELGWCQIEPGPARKVLTTRIQAWDYLRDLLVRGRSSLTKSRGLVARLRRGRFTGDNSGGGSSRIANGVRLSFPASTPRAGAGCAFSLWQPVRAPNWETPACARMRPDGVRQAGCAPQALTAIAALLVVVSLLGS